MFFYERKLLYSVAWKKCCLATAIRKESKIIQIFIIGSNDLISSDKFSASLSSVESHTDYVTQLESAVETVETLF